MQIGLVGAGSMARAMARGWGEPVLCTDAGSGRAAALAQELGGEALASNTELAARADLVVLCHKPAARLVVETMAGTAELLRARGGDAAAVRREVTSPGGYTERGLAVLERAGVPAAFEQAIAEVAGGRQS